MRVPPVVVEAAGPAYARSGRPIVQETNSTGDNSIVYVACREYMICRLADTGKNGDRWCYPRFIFLTAHHCEDSVFLEFTPSVYAVRSVAMPRAQVKEKVSDTFSGF